MKRALDFIFSALLLVFLSPIFLIIVAAVKISSKGPAFFTQRRIGKNNKEFILYKFRTMKIGTPDVATHLLSNPKQYITRVGKVLRKTSFDELPQLLNILKGNMSIIGPRPALYNQYDLIKLRTKVNVHKLIPGVTGWAQINGRDALTIEKKVEFDEYYLKHKSLVFDIKIFIFTLFKVLRAEGVLEGGQKGILPNRVEEEIEFQKEVAVTSDTYQYAEQKL